MPLSPNLLNLLDLLIIPSFRGMRKLPRFANFVKIIPCNGFQIAEVIGEGKFTDITKNLLVVLAANGRIRDISKVIIR